MADLLTDPTTLAQLKPFLGRPSSVGQAARETGEKPNTVLARVRRLLSQGLLMEVGRVRRQGKPIRLYQTVANTFFIPFEVTSASTLESALAERDSYFEELLRQNVVRARSESVGMWGTRIYRDSRGRLQVQTAITPERNYTSLDPEAPAVLSAWRDQLYLDFDDAKELQRRLFELLLEYQRKSGAQRYILRLGLAPVAEK